tara:strand:+ start:42720 stop:44165 length:1446 start_codon:yes stop_codon:yes gene_type:complete
MSKTQLATNEVIENSGISFGTSGARGLVVDFSSDVCAAFTHAFISVMKSSWQFDTIAIAIDNRPSSYAMAMACAEAAKQRNISVEYYGVVPTPALAYSAMQRNIPSIMVTGSHIPFDRNGLKFYRPDGEISKQDEQAILSVNAAFSTVDDLTELDTDLSAADEYIKRYTSIFDSNALAGKRIGIYEHSSAGRDLYHKIFSALGAEVVALERTDTFVPIDTEAVGEEDKEKAKAWSKQHHLDAIFSTDGDGDRPLVADEKGNWLRGDILGLLCADALEADALAIPVSCNTAVELSAKFNKVIRTKIGSPYVIAEFAVLAQEYNRVAGFEANGGFLLGSSIQVGGHELKALPTRDAVLPAIMVLATLFDDSLSSKVAQLPERFTASDRVQNFATQRSQQIISDGLSNPQRLLNRLQWVDEVVDATDNTDGFRMSLKSGNVIHLRPSGNAPELRCYAEADTEPRAQEYVLKTLSAVEALSYHSE